MPSKIRPAPPRWLRIVLLPVALPVVVVVAAIAAAIKFVKASVREEATRGGE